MPSRKGSRKAAARKGSRKARRVPKSSYWTPGNLFNWLTTPGHVHSEKGSRKGSKKGSRKTARKTARKGSRKGSRSKRSEGYVAQRRRSAGVSISLKESAAYKRRHHSRRTLAGVSVGGVSMGLKESTAYKRRHSHSAHCKDASKYGSRKPYCKDSAKYGSRKGKKTGAVCVCAMQCTKKHEHDKKCQASVVCVCAAGLKKSKGSRKSAEKMAVSYRRPKIVREGYVRKDGVVVSPTLIEDKGKPGKGPKLLPKLRSGTLTRHGYSSKLPMEERREALAKAVDAEGPTVVIRKLNVVATLNKNTHPHLAKELKADSAWVKSTYGTTAHPL